MRYLITILIFFVFIFSIDKKFDTIYYESYFKALNFLTQNEQEFVKELGDDYLKRVEKIAIVFPELLKYSIYKDILETAALELIYVNYGKSHADFSIGYFQMKPSFIENLEEEILQNDWLLRKYKVIISYDGLKLKEIRKERINRLKTLEWQLRYLNCFYDFVSIQYENQNWITIEHKIKFFATAYNYDFRAEKDEVEKWINQKIFPFGLTKGKKQYAYSDIAFYYYRNTLVH